MLHTEPLNKDAQAYFGLNHKALEGTVLATIINAKVLDVKKYKAVKLNREHKIVSLKKALSSKGRNFILECKQSSPTLGDFCKDFNLDKLISVYKEHANAISVLCEEHFFKGSLNYLNYVKSNTDLPCLCKDFIICKSQIDMAYNAGADAILLMLSVLDKEYFLELYNYALKLNLDVLVEVENEDEAYFAKEHNFPIVGINNRDLKTLKVDLNKAMKLYPIFNQDQIVISESGINTHKDLVSLRPISNFLIGSALTSNKDVSFKAKSMLYGLNKVCGIKTREALRACVKGHASIAGFIFVEKSPRFISPAEALALKDEFLGKIKFCGVFMDDELEKIVNIATLLSLDYVQLHGTENKQFIKNLKEKLPHIKIIKALTIENKDSFKLFNDYMPLCDLFILDAKKPGSGCTFNWNEIPDYVLKEKTLLSGGIGLENLQSALEQNFIGLDLNSKLESEKGLKDPNKIKEALEMIKNF